VYFYDRRHVNQVLCLAVDLDAAPGGPCVLVEKRNQLVEAVDNLLFAEQEVKA
jgi:23S rRNA C2498 (ribose-2'-O)-methylase RlmM